MSNLLQMPQRRAPVHRCAESIWTEEELSHYPRQRPNGKYSNHDESNERVVNGVALVVFAGVMVLIGYWICR